MAVQRDMETIGVIAANDPAAVLSLSQPAHTDSKASQYLQMRLQQLLGGQPMVVAHRDAHDYVPGGVANNGPTTSYIVTLYGADPVVMSGLDWPDQSRVVFGGDVFLGRGWRTFLETQSLGSVVADLNARRGVGEFVANIEGVILPERPAGSNTVQHLMLDGLVLPVLNSLGVSTANTANNHSHDFGADGLTISQTLLKGAAITPIAHGEVSEVAGLSLLPLSFKRGYFYDHPVIRTLEQLDEVCMAKANLPLVVLAHWGADYSDTAGPDELAALERFARCGVVAVIGAHPHQASSAVTLHGGGRLQAVFSMGNLLFDQTGDVSGALVELRRFAKGTIALRLIPVPNYFQMAQQQP
jgi:poly-gamma-glutamate synthesis protein (capsule biosynthesis protein)